MIYKTLHRKQDRPTRSPLKPAAEHRCSGSVSSSCFTDDTSVILLSERQFQLYRYAMSILIRKRKRVVKDGTFNSHMQGIDNEPLISLLSAYYLFYMYILIK